MIRLLVLDVDGVLVPGEAAPFDLPVLQRFAVLNDRARHDPTCLAVTLCTGRPAPYVEALMQALHGFYPAVYEHGAGVRWLSQEAGLPLHAMAGVGDAQGDMPVLQHMG